MIRIAEQREQEVSEFAKADAVKNFSDYDFIKEYIIPCLVKKNGNQNFLKNIAVVDFLDVAIVFRVLLKINDYSASVLITAEHLKEWGRTCPDILSDVKQNMPKFKVSRLDDIILKELNDTENILEGEIEVGEHMLVLTNERRTYGAATMLDTEPLKKISLALGGDFFILPSSVHETICIPYKSADKEILDEMVKEVNQQQVPLEEQLEDHAYIYRAETGVIEY